MPRQLVSPPGVFSPGTFSHYAVAQGSTIVMLAGQVPVDAEGNLVGEGDLYAQTVATMRNLQAVMAHAGLSWGDIVRRTIYTTQPDGLREITRAVQEVTGEVTGEHPGPPQSLVGVSGLAHPGFLVEIECTAVTA